MIESVVTYFMYFNQVYLLMYFDQAKNITMDKIHSKDKTADSNPSNL